MANNYFKFKQFTILQEKAAMKVGTDGILLGAWADVKNANKILDVGAGTGLIALMMAQRTNAKITGIEIEGNAACEAKQNVANSPWRQRIEIENISYQDFAEACTEGFDLIVSNPPFFSNALKTESKVRTLARHTDTLPFKELLSCSARILNNEGSLAVILPVLSANDFVELALKIGLFLIRKTEVKPNRKKTVNRILLQFSKREKALRRDCLTIYSGVGEYSNDFRKITRDYYVSL